MKNNKRELILRNGRTYFNGDEILQETDKFDRAFFDSIREGGFTAIWIRGELRRLVNFAEAPHWDDRNAERIAALNRIIAMGKTSGIAVYLYFNEPIGFNEGDPIFERYPDLKGPVSLLANHPACLHDPKYAFCTQCEFVDTYLIGGYQQLFEKCPGIRGVILITASEYLTHCYSNVDVLNLLHEDFKYREVKCPRCQKFTPIQTVCSVVARIHEGIRRVSATANVVAWNWSWAMYEATPQRELISGLPPDVIVMCDMQRGGEKVIDGQKVIVDEYSFSYLGPSALYKGVAATAASQHRPLWAKVPVNTTHEFLITPYLPLPWRVAKKYLALRELGTEGAMCCWNYGCDPTWMARLAARAFTDESLTLANLDEAVHQIATRIYGAPRAAQATAAWKEFDEAFELFPFDLHLVYYGPHHYGTGFEWIFTPEEIPMPWYWVRNTARGGTKLSDFCVQFTPERVANLLEKLTQRWARGIQILAGVFDVANPCDAIPGFNERVALPGFEDFNIARTMHLHYLSTIAFIQFRLATLDFFDSGQDRATPIIRNLLEQEKPRIRAMKQILEHYPKIGFEGESQHRLYTPGDLEQKVKNIDLFRFERGHRI